VLSIEEHSGGVPLHDTDLVDMCSKLLRLRYLGLKETPINVLPPEIGRLQNLEALDVSYTEVSGLPKEVMELWRLKTLDLSNTQVGELLREIEGLRNLKALGISSTQVGELPREIGELQHLETLDISNTQVGELPREIGGLQELKNLDLSNTQVGELPRETGKLQYLRTLDISNTNVRELPACLFSRLSFVLVTDKSVKLSDGDLDILRAWKTDNFSSSLVALREDLSIMLCDDFCQLLPVACLKVVRRHMRIPKWVREHLANVSSLDIRLCKLEDEDLKFLQGMPNLKILTLRLEVPPKEPIVITGGGFSGLVSFTVDCHRLPPVTFKEEPKKPAVPNRNIGDASKEKAAMPNHEHPEPSKQEVMPNLEHLEFKFYAGRALGKGPVGITQLKSLTRVAFRSSKWYSSDAPGNRVVIDQVRKEAKEHPKGITISVNGKEDGIVFLETKDMGSGRSGSSKMEARLVDKAIIEKKDRLLREAVEQEKL
jgi:Leucine-rich repeat (LRR) protein